MGPQTQHVQPRADAARAAGALTQHAQRAQRRVAARSVGVREEVARADSRASEDVRPPDAPTMVQDDASATASSGSLGETQEGADSARYPKLKLKFLKPSGPRSCRRLLMLTLRVLSQDLGDARAVVSRAEGGPVARQTSAGDACVYPEIKVAMVAPTSRISSRRCSQSRRSPGSSPTPRRTRPSFPMSRCISRSSAARAEAQPVQQAQRRSTAQADCVLWDCVIAVAGSQRH